MKGFRPLRLRFGGKIVASDAGRCTKKATLPSNLLPKFRAEGATVEIISQL